MDKTGYFQKTELSPHIEEAILLEEILLPELPPFPTMEEIHEDHIYYPWIIEKELYTDVVGKFSIPIITPLGQNMDEPFDEVMIPEVRNIVNGAELSTTEYEKSNYIELVIPRYIVLNFITKIPVHTKFIVCFIGDKILFNNIKIIGVSERGSEEE